MSQPNTPADSDIVGRALLVTADDLAAALMTTDWFVQLRDEVA